MINWDDAFDNSSYVVGSEALPAHWAASALSARQALLKEGRAELDLSYGPDARMAYDMFSPISAPKGTVIFVHGGFWQMLSKSDWSHYAIGCLENGWNVAMPSYPLAPQARIADITKAIAKAVTTIADSTTGPISLVGHSAGGHLVTRMACANVLSETVEERLSRVTSISGVHHLAPLLKTQMNDTLRLTEAEARTEGPVHLSPNIALPLTFWVGAEERPEFLRQNRMMAERWAAKGAQVRTMYAPEKHHFNVIDGLLDPSDTLTQEVLF
jgi:acetyl esterase/lipase